MDERGSDLYMLFYVEVMIVNDYGEVKHALRTYGNLAGAMTMPTLGWRLVVVPRIFKDFQAPGPLFFVTTPRRSAHQASTATILYIPTI
jgi:hypothetical protein